MCMPYKYIYGVNGVQSYRPKMYIKTYNDVIEFERTKR